MAQLTTKNVTGVVDKRRGRGVTDTGHTNPGNLISVAAARARLTAINGTLYTSSYLDKMTLNDMVNAIRLNDEAAGV